MSTATIGQAYNTAPSPTRFVERATGKQINAVAPEEAKPGWINLDL